MRLDIPQEQPRRSEIAPETHAPTDGRKSPPVVPETPVQQRLDALRERADHRQPYHPRSREERGAASRADPREPRTRTVDPEDTRRPRRVPREIIGLELREEEKKLLTEVGRFRVIRVEDLNQTIYGGKSRKLENDLSYLRDKGLVETQRVNLRHDGKRRTIERVEVVTLTKAGRGLLIKDGDLPKDQKVYAGLVKLEMAPKSKAHIRSVMHLMFECAARWELFNDRRNPIQIVRVKDGSKRRQRPTVLTVQEYETILGLLKEPYRTMVIVAQCLGLRVSEIAALQWQDFDFERQQLLVQRSIVNGNVDDVKTEYSRDHVPLDAALVEVLLVWSKEATPSEEGWVFASPSTNKPYQTTEIQKRHIRPAGCCLVECPKCGAGVGVWCSQVKPTPNGKRLLIHEERQAAAGKYGHLGWHTFRHTYHSWLDETGAPMKVQQELMRHASIQTTMNVYGQAMTSSKREANSKVVEMVLKPMKASA